MEYININDDVKEKNTFEKLCTNTKTISNTDIDYAVKFGIIHSMCDTKKLPIVCTNYKKWTQKEVALRNNYIEKHLIDSVMGMFKHHKELQFVVLDTNITVIGENTFKNCNNLKAIYLNKNINKIEKDVFKNCKKLKKIYYEGTKKDFNKIIIDKNEIILESFGHGATFQKKIINYDGNDILQNCILYYNCKVPNGE